MSENTEKEPFTTAAALGAYDKELQEQGFGPDMRESLVLKASEYLLQFGLEVKS